MLTTTAIPTAFRNVFLQAAVIALSLTATTYALAIAVGWITPDGVSLPEVFAGIFNYAATFLCIKQRRAYALVGIIGTAAWSYVFFSNNLLASGVVNIYLAGMLVYGYWRWGKDTNTRKVRHIGLKWVPVYLIVTVAIYLGAVAITTAFGGSFVFWDAAILVLTILAQLLQDQKVIEAWVVWTAVNVVGVILYFNAELYFAVIQQFIFGFANLWGWMDWRKTMIADRAVKEI